MFSKFIEWVKSFFKSIPMTEEELKNEKERVLNANIQQLIYFYYGGAASNEDRRIGLIHLLAKYHRVTGEDLNLLTSEAYRVRFIDPQDLIKPPSELH